MKQASSEIWSDKVGSSGIWSVKLKVVYNRHTEARRLCIISSKTSKNNGKNIYKK